jgi:hypothetical protein
MRLFDDDFSIRGGLQQMAHKYGLFGNGVQTPAQTFEGDKMMWSGEYIFIYRLDTGKEVPVAAIRLSEGQCVKEIS